MSLPSKLYQQKIANNTLISDNAQESILPILNDLAQKINDYGTKIDNNGVTIWQYNDVALKGIFICGDVGRGKSMLMQLLFDSVDIKEKRRVHFHPFMEEMHERMHEPREKNGKDIILQIASDIAKTAKLLCFDEFYVTNIGDAVLLGRLLEAFFKCGVILCATSNWKIKDLYQDGHNRSLFQPFIKIIKNNMEEVNLDSENDWRRKNVKSKKSSLIDVLNNKKNWQKGKIDLEDTIIPLSHYKDDILIVNFKDICDIHIGRYRYLLLAKQAKGIIISNIPYLIKERTDAAIRFITLVDLLYEYKVPLLVTSTHDIENICEEEQVAYIFQRTLSRIIELKQL